MKARAVAYSYSRAIRGEIIREQNNNGKGKLKSFYSKNKEKNYVNVTIRDEIFLIIFEENGRRFTVNALNRAKEYFGISKGTIGEKRAFEFFTKIYNEEISFSISKTINVPTELWILRLRIVIEA